MNNNPIVGFFSNYNDANEAVSELMTKGYSKDDISLIAKEDSLNGAVSQNRAKTQNRNGVNNNLADGTDTGARSGAMVGGLAGLLVGISALAIPGIGPVITLGTLSSAVGATAVGASGGGIVGGLIGLVLSEDEAEYEKSLTDGSILVSVDANSNTQLVQDNFAKHKAIKVH